MQITEEMILDTIDRIKERPEFLHLKEESQDLVIVYLAQMGLELRRKLNDN